MNGTSRCVKVTFSVVGTRTLEYMINEDKEYQGKIYFTFLIRKKLLMKILST